MTSMEAFIKPAIEREKVRLQPELMEQMEFVCS